MTIPQRLDRMIHPFMLRRVLRAYNKKMDVIARRRPDLFAPVDAETTRKHLELWGRLGCPCNDKWLRLLTHMSGVPDYRYCPDDLYYAIIERILNDCDAMCRMLDDKNMLGRIVDSADCPKTFLRYMRGEFFDGEYRWLSALDASNILRTDHGPVIGKVCVDSLGGHGVTSYEFKGGHYESSGGEMLTIDVIKRLGVSYIIQERVSQCDFSAMFNPASANTCRIISLRCPWNGKTRVIAAGMRFGVTSAAIDNMSSGGICVALGPHGELAKEAVGNWCAGKPLSSHPTSGVSFAGKVHPFWDKMCETACRYQAVIPNANMLSWDMVVDDKGAVKILEVNAVSQGIDWPQFAFGPLFGDDTEDLVEWCRSNARLNSFKHFRTWY